MAGVRMITCRLGDTPSEQLTLVGSDDGQSWWTVHGKLSGNSVEVDFSPLGGPTSVTGAYANGKITWPDGNVFTKQSVGSCCQCATPGQDVGGFYTDPNHYQSGS